MKQILVKIFDIIAIIINQIIDRTKTSGISSQNVHSILWSRAAEQSANYIEDYVDKCMIFPKRKHIWQYALKQLDHKRPISLELGVHKGESINFFSKQLPKFKFYGLDSFEGLREDWKGHDATQGAFSLGGRLPKVNSNVTLVKGWFDETLPELLRTLSIEQIGFVHVDGDTYEAANEVFNSFKPLAGTIILFDEYLGYPNWQNGEYRAWQEYCQKEDLQYEYLAFTTSQALIRVL